MQMWFEATRLAGFDVAAVIPVRHPQEVIASVAARRQGLAGAHKRLVAEIHPAGRERHTRPAACIRRLRQPPGRLAPGNSADLRKRSRSTSPPEMKCNRGVSKTGPSAPATQRPSAGALREDWMSAVYEACARRTGRALGYVCAGSRIRGVSSERAWFPDGARGVPPPPHRLNRRHPGPSIVKLGLEALALAHRRRGTWA